MTFDESAYLRGAEVAVKLTAPDETVWLRLGNNEVARIEEEFDGIQGFSVAFSTRPQSTFRRYFAITLGEPTDPESLAKVGERLIPSESPAYAAAIEASWLIANGGSAEDAGKAWRGRLTLAQTSNASVVEAFEKFVTVTALTNLMSALRDIPGENGSKPSRASSRGGRSRSSGD